MKRSLVLLGLCLVLASMSDAAGKRDRGQQGDREARAGARVGRGNKPPRADKLMVLCKIEVGEDVTFERACPLPTLLSCLPLQGRRSRGHTGRVQKTKSYCLPKPCDGPAQCPTDVACVSRPIPTGSTVAAPTSHCNISCDEKLYVKACKVQNADGTVVVGTVAECPRSGICNDDHVEDITVLGANYKAFFCGTPTGRTIRQKVCREARVGGAGRGGRGGKGGRNREAGGARRSGGGRRDRAEGANTMGDN